MTCDSPLQKVSYGMYYCTQSAPLNTIIVPIKGAALSGLLPPHPVTPSGWLLSKKVIILTLATQLQKETYAIVWSSDSLKPFRWLVRLIGLKRTKQLPPLFQVQTRADLISKITGCNYLLWVLCISLYGESYRRKGKSSEVLYHMIIIWFTICGSWFSSVKSIVCTIAFDPPH
jgi:hypothetical protein